ncbi:protein-tyrosine phosphatase-like protein [Pterulicium gracile]|uniref:Protein-tyrosine phosphatase-like protein n=1 Tax=Pterulicium gracile TaxID=1884261 RepID=A0A5C3QRN1_9AGAR|nr:protein-tyrosine phosphatase-like protein [Pterula gracilis]
MHQPPAHHPPAKPTTTLAMKTTDLAMRRTKAQYLPQGDSDPPMHLILPSPNPGHVGALHLGSLAATRNPSLLAYHGIKHVYHLMRPGWEWAVDLEEADMYSTMIPLCDALDADLLSNLDVWVDSLHGVLGRGRNVLVHCRAGVSRSASLVIAYMIKYRSLSYVDAHQYVAARRSQIDPNPTFVQDLRLFEMSCRIRENGGVDLNHSGVDIQSKIASEMERRAVERRLADQEMSAQKEILLILERDFGIGLDC